MLTKNLGDVFEQSRNEQTFNLENVPHSWNVKFSANREKPRFVIIGFH